MQRDRAHTQRASVSSTISQDASIVPTIAASMGITSPNRYEAHDTPFRLIQNRRASTTATAAIPRRTGRGCGVSWASISPATSVAMTGKNHVGIAG